MCSRVEKKFNKNDDVKPPRKPTVAHANTPGSSELRDWRRTRRVAGSHRWSQVCVPRTYGGDRLLECVNAVCRGRRKHEPVTHTTFVSSRMEFVDRIPSPTIHNTAVQDDPTTAAARLRITVSGRFSSFHGSVKKIRKI